MFNRKSVCVSLILLATCLAGMPSTQAQSNDQGSVADAARRAREQKKAAAKPGQVVTNDTLEPAKAVAAAPKPESATEAPMAPASAAPGTEEAAANANVAPANVAKSEESAADVEKKKAEEKKALEALKRQIREKQQEVDLAQRGLALASDTFYSRPDFSRDTDGKAKLDAMQSDLSQKQDELAQLKAKLPPGTSLEDDKSGTPPRS